MEYLRYHEENAIAVLTIERPKELNSLNSAVLKEMADIFDTLTTSSIRCLIITGYGEKAFVAGADIAEMADMTPEEALAYSHFGNTVLNKLESLAFPVIAAINGYALGGGLELALSCDIRLGAENAVFALPEVSLGIIPGYGGLQKLAGLVGAAKAAELALSARRIKAPEALALGLINHAYPPEALMEQALALAAKIAANAPYAVREAKRVLRQCTGLTRQQALYLEEKAFAACFDTADQKEAMAAFLQKRPPQPFTGK